MVWAMAHTMAHGRNYNWVKENYNEEESTKASSVFVILYF